MLDRYPGRGVFPNEEALQVIARGGWDVVVLQEDLPETTVADFEHFGSLFHEEIQKSGAATVLLTAWPYERYKSPLSSIGPMNHPAILIVLIRPWYHPYFASKLSSDPTNHY